MYTYEEGPLQKSLPAENGYFFLSLRRRVLNDAPHRLWRVLEVRGKNPSFSASEHTFAEVPTLYAHVSSMDYFLLRGVTF